MNNNQIKQSTEAMLMRVSEKASLFIAAVACCARSFAASATTTVTSSGDAFAEATTAVTSLQERLVNLAGVLFPLSMVICCIALLFTHDEKALKTEWKILGSLCVVYGLLVLVSGGTITSTIQNLFTH